MRTRGISIAIATALYSFFLCPKPIKDAATAFELAQRESGYLKAMGLEQAFSTSRRIYEHEP